MPKGTGLHGKLLASYTSVLIVLSLAYLLPPDLVFNDVERFILIQLKLPVLLTALLVGSSIAAASACLQVLLRNPLADPGIIGISSGASLMAASVILLSGTAVDFIISPQLSIYALPLLCFAGAFASSLLIFAMARWMGGAISAVILAGIAISTLCSAIIGWMFLIAPAQKMQSLTFWLMGSLHNTNWSSLGVSLPIACICLALLFTQLKQLNQLYLGDQAAQLSGVDVKRFQTKSLLLISMLVGLSVSIAGSIAFLGLLVPHLIRRLHGNNNRIVVPLSAVLGAALMVLCALINSHLSTIILPISMLTASLGAPIFAYVMLKQRTRI